MLLWIFCYLHHPAGLEKMHKRALIIVFCVKNIEIVIIFGWLLFKTYSCYYFND